jgi:osmotically-inducible protein OsmY
VQDENGVVRLTGQVQSTDEADHATWILGELAGVDEVIDDTTLAPAGTE